MTALKKQNVTDIFNPQESEGQIQSKDMDNLKIKSETQLKELLERHKNILSKPYLLNKLPDKGEKIKKLTARVQNELESRKHISNSVDAMAASLASVTLNTDALEWNAIETNTSLKSERDFNPSDPLLKYIQSSKDSKTRTFDPYVEALCSKYDSRQEPKLPRRKFLPCRSTEKNNQTNSSSASSTPESKKSSGVSPSVQDTLHQLPMKDSLVLEKKNATVGSGTTGTTSLLSKWREMADTIESDTEEELEEEQKSLKFQEEEYEQDPPEIA